MVASILKIGKIFGWRVWSLVLLWSFAGPSPSFGGRLIEEDLPPEPARIESPIIAPLKAAPVSLEPARIRSPIVTPLEALPAPPEPVRTAVPVVVPSESMAIPPQPFMGEEVPFVREEIPSGATNAPPPLPTKDVLSPKEVVALRFVEEGRDAIEQGDLNRARVRFERAMSVAPLQPYSYYFLGRLALARGEHQQALAFLQRAELLFPPKDRVWRGETAGLKGTVYEDLGDYDQARTAYQRCLRFTPSHLKALSAVARLSVEEPLPSENSPQ